MMLIILLATTTLAYPVIISDSQFNHTKNKVFTHEFDQYEAMDYVDQIYFIWEPWVTNAAGYFLFYAYRDLECYNTKIWITYNFRETLHHELCHIQYHCIDHKKEINETHAETCTLYGVRKDVSK